MTFDTKTTTQHWMQFLQTMDQVATPDGIRIKICPKLTMYRNRQSRQLYVRDVQGRAARKISLGVWTQVAGDATIANWSLGMPIGTFLPLIRSYASGSLAIFTNAIDNASEQQSKCVTSWHTYAIFYRDGVLGVYDPSYIHGTRIFDLGTRISLLKHLVKALHGTATNHTITEIWIGGGGNNSRECQEMTRKWVAHEIGDRMGLDLGNREEWEGWTKVHF